MKTATLKWMGVVGFVAAFLPSAHAIFETGYTFESPSVSNNVQDVLKQLYPSTTHYYLEGDGRGPTLTAAAAKHGSVGLDFTTFSGDNMTTYSQPNYSWLQPQSTSITFQQGMTLGMWVNPSVLDGNYRYLAYTGPGVQLNWYITPANKVEFWGYVPGFTGYATSTTSLSLGQWTHVAVTWDDVSDTVKLYMNGALESSLAGITSLSGGVGTQPIHFGQDPGAGGSGPTTQFHGYMDDIYFSDFAKTQTEIQDLMNVIPEPTTVTLLGLGGLVLFRRLRKSTSRS
jgi:hypothetical protein